MIDISTTQVMKATQVDAIVRAVNPNAFGVSTGGYGTHIHLPDDANSTVQQDAQNILDNYGSLSISASVTTLNEGDADPIVTCDDASISGDSDMGYVVLMDGDIYATGTASVVSGEATLNLVSPVAGEYEVFMYRLSGNYASGSVNITVSEV